MYDANIIVYDASGYKFTGKERDAESGLDYFGARYYGSNTSRFTTPDPLLATLRQENPQTLNKYTYTPTKNGDSHEDEWVGSDPDK
ncbi:MAG: RHS repeat-associated core domain-containing protein [Terriglobia bacterium]